MIVGRIALIGFIPVEADAAHVAIHSWGVREAVTIRFFRFFRG